MLDHVSFSWDIEVTACQYENVRCNMEYISMINMTNYGDITVDFIFYQLEDMTNMVFQKGKKESAQG